MSIYSPWSRRRFLQSTGTLTAAISSLPTLVHAPLLSQAPKRQYAYVGSAEGYGSLHVFAVDDRGWTPLQSVVSPQPSAFALHPSANVLYVTNRISLWQGLPCGSVEAYEIEPQGTLTKLGHRPLSLSATLPTGLAVSPDGHHLVVASHGGGAYNLLPLGPDGGLQCVASIVKETGCGPHPRHQLAAHPHTVLFDITGNYVLGSDTGADRLSSFRLDAGGLERAGQAGLPAGSGPSHMVFHPSGCVLYVCNWLQPSLSAFAYHALEGRVGRALSVAPLSSGNAAFSSLAIHPTGRFLYTSAEGVTVWKIDSHTGGLHEMTRLEGDFASSGKIAIGAEGRFLYSLQEASGEICEARIDQITGHLTEARTVAAVPKPRSLLFATPRRATA